MRATAAVVFDEWVLVSLEQNRARILHYTGPRNDEFLKSFVNDLGPLRTGAARCQIRSGRL